MKDLLDKLLDILYKITEFLDKMSEKIFEQTKVKVDLKVIVVGAIGLLIIIIFLRAILGYVWSQL